MLNKKWRAGRKNIFPKQKNIIFLYKVIIEIIKTIKSKENINTRTKRNVQILCLLLGYSERWEIYYMWAKEVSVN